MNVKVIDTHGAHMENMLCCNGNVTFLASVLANPSYTLETITSLAHPPAGDY